MSADATTLPRTVDVHDDHHTPKDALFIKIAVILAVITGVEVAWSYLPWSDWGEGGAIVFAELGGLLIMMAVKFYIVAAFFMHLKFDSKILTRVFYAGLALAIAVYLAVLATFEIFTGGLS
jgi:cytochrome c oxidase subunit 4